jgi:hypothetical protein
MSRRTIVIAAALLLLIGARMPVWREAAAANTPSARSGGSGTEHGWGAERAAWQLAPALRRRLGIVLAQVGS